MNCRFVVLMRWICVVGSQKRENRRYIRASAGGKPINAANDALVNFGAAGKIRIIRIRRGNGVNGITGAVGSHVGSTIELRDTKTMGGELRKGGLTEVDGEMALG